MKTLVQGQHWLLDFSECLCPPALLADRDTLAELCLRACREAGMHIVGSAMHQFEPTGVTGVVLLAESHLSVHTWPQERHCAIDVYVCNHDQDNTAKGQRLVDAMRSAFAPALLRERRVARDSVAPVQP